MIPQGVTSLIKTGLKNQSTTVFSTKLTFERLEVSSPGVK